jgi:transposase
MPRPVQFSGAVDNAKGANDHGSGRTAWRRLREWQDAGVWDRLHQLVLDELSDIDELDWTRGCIDAVSVRSKRGAS